MDQDLIKAIILHEDDKPDFINYELSLDICGRRTKVFLQRGFFVHNVPLGERPSPYSFPVPHLHNYAEIHIFVGEGIKLTYENEVMIPEPSSVILIPGGVYHSTDIPPSAVHCAFQIDIPTDERVIKTLPTEFLTEFTREIQRSAATKNYSGIEKYITFIASHFIPSSTLEMKKVADYAFIIHQYMALFYNKDILLSDLAERLHISEKQTARLVLKHTGKKFSDALTSYRMSAAEQLINTYPDMPISKVATLVGYQSYSGFWKAYKKYKEEN